MAKSCLMAFVQHCIQKVLSFAFQYIQIFQPGFRSTGNLQPLAKDYKSRFYKRYIHYIAEEDCGQYFEDRIKFLMKE